MHGHALDHRWWIPAFVNVDHLDDPVRPAWGLAHGQLWTLFALASLSSLRIHALASLVQGTTKRDFAHALGGPLRVSRSIFNALWAQLAVFALLNYKALTNLTFVRFKRRPT